MPRRKKTVDISAADNSFYVISSLEYEDPKPLFKKKRFETEDAAVEHCREVIASRGRQHHDPITLCVLKVVSAIVFKPTPIEVRKYK